MDSSVSCDYTIYHYPINISYSRGIARMASGAPLCASDKLKSQRGRCLTIPRSVPGPRSKEQSNHGYRSFLLWIDVAPSDCEPPRLAALNGSDMVVVTAMTRALESHCWRCSAGINLGSDQPRSCQPPPDRCVTDRVNSDRNHRGRSRRNPELGRIPADLSGVISHDTVSARVTHLRMTRQRGEEGA